MDLLEFVKKLIHIRRSEPVLRRRRFFHEVSMKGTEAHDIAWVDVDGAEMSDADWQTAHAKCLGVILFGDLVDVDPEGKRVSGNTLLLLFNADHGDPISFTLPRLADADHWLRVLDTSDPAADESLFQSEHPYHLQSASLALFRKPTEEETT
jgi:glycogen operon protein